MLEAAGLVRVAASTADRRIRVARLTARGRAERTLLDDRSDELAGSLLAALGPADRERLVDAMRTVERLLTATSVQLLPVDPSHPDARQCLRAYFAELDGRSQDGLHSDAALPVQPRQLRDPEGCLLIAYLRSEPVGCGGVKHPAGAPAEIKRMWVSPEARGLGIARRLLEELERRAAAAGARTVRLDTNRALTEAISMYRSGGYRKVAPFNDEAFADFWFEKRL